MKDSRGVDRGRCSQCACSEFNQSDGQSVRCSCGHSPTQHQNLSAASCSPSTGEPSVARCFLAPTAATSNASSTASASNSRSTASSAVNTSAQDGRGPTLCAFPDCRKPALLNPNTGEGWDVCQDHIDCTRADVVGRLFQFAGSKLPKLFQELTLGGNPVPEGHGQEPSQAPKCSNPRCSRTCFSKPDGTYFKFCGITCRNHYQKSTISLTTGDAQDETAPPCSNPSCKRTCYPKEDGTYFDYCGKTCRNLSRFQAPAMPGPLCSLPGCKLPQDRQGRYDGYCGDDHRLKGFTSRVLVEIDGGTQEFSQVSHTFTQQWVKPLLMPAPTDLKIFKVYNHTLESQFQAYTQSLKYTSTEQHFHGTVLCCDLSNSKSACTQTKCGICGIGRRGFDPAKIGSNISRFKRFGMGMYLAPNSSKCHDYTQGCHGYRALLLCDVAPGRKYEVLQDQTKLTAPPRGYDSVYGKHGKSLNYDEIVLYNKDAILPKYVIMYQKDGVKQIAT